MGFGRRPEKRPKNWPKNWIKRLRIKPQIVNVLRGLCLLALALTGLVGCHYTGRTTVTKGPNQSRVLLSFESPHNAAIRIALNFPPEATPDAHTVEIHYDITVDRKWFRGDVSILGESPFRVERITLPRSERELLVDLDWNPHYQPHRYRSPAEREFDLDQYSQGIGLFQKVKKKWLGLSKIPVSRCNGTLVGKSLALTALHCAQSLAECKASELRLWDKSELLGPPSFPCVEIVKRAVDLDQVLIRVEGAPEEDYPVIPVVEDSYFYPKDTPIWIISENPTNTKRIRSCTVGEARSSMAIRQKTDSGNGLIRRLSLAYTLPGCVEIPGHSRGVMPGDSGTAVLNLEGRIIGVVVAISTSNGSSTFTPLDPSIRRLLR